jgi:hypothetical protein
MKSSKCNLSNETRNLIFNEFDSIQKKMYKSAGHTAARRFSEPRKLGYGYRCKWWFFRLTPIQLVKIRKSLPKGWTIESVSSGGTFIGKDFRIFTTGIPCITVRTNKYPN